MACLLDLPNEVLAQAFSYLDKTHLRPCDWDSDSGEFTGEEWTNTRPSLCAVALVNHRLYRIARQILLEDISIHIGSSGTRYRFGFEYDAVRFTKYCMEFPAVLEHLRKFHVWWCTPSSEDWATNFFNTVSLAPNLVVFDVERLEDYTRPLIRLKILEGLVQRLQSVEIFVFNSDDVFIPHHLFLAICGMPHLRSFETNCPILGPDPKAETTVSIDDFFDDTPVDHVQEIRLEKLSCTGEYVDLAVLRHVLMRSPQLKRLILSLPGPWLSTYYGNPSVPVYLKAKHLGYQFRPDLVTRMLLPCASTLCELTITNELMELSQTNGTTIDLSSFSKLRNLTISNRLLCKVKGMSGLDSLETELPDKEWYKALPTSLESLKIQFDCLGGLLWNLVSIRLLRNAYKTEWHSDDAEVIRKAYAGWHSNFGTEYFKPSIGREIQHPTFHHLSWIMNLARNVSSKFEHLKKIKVVENPTVPLDNANTSWQLIDLVKAYPETFGCPGLDLELSVRVPDLYVPPQIEKIKAEYADGSLHSTADSFSQDELLRALYAQNLTQEAARHVLELQEQDTDTGWGNDRSSSGQTPAPQPAPPGMDI